MTNKFVQMAIKQLFPMGTGKNNYTFKKVMRGLHCTNDIEETIQSTGSFQPKKVEKTSQSLNKKSYANETVEEMEEIAE